MECRSVIVVGGSAGAVEPLQELVGGLPRELAAAVCVVLHLGNRQSMLPELFSRVGSLPACWASRRRSAPAGAHLCRPARPSSAGNAATPADLPRPTREWHPPGVGPAVPLRRGSLWPGGHRGDPVRHARRRHGRVQRDQARGRHDRGAGSQRRAVSKHAGHGALQRDGGLLCACQRDSPASWSGWSRAEHPQQRHRFHERPVQSQPVKEGTEVEDDYQLGDPVALTCPECGGALKESRMDSLPYYTCHIGHRYAGPDMDEAQFRMMEQALAIALRALNERAALCQRLAASAEQKSQALSAQRWAEPVRRSKQEPRCWSSSSSRNGRIHPQLPTTRMNSPCSKGMADFGSLPSPGILIRVV